MTATDAALDAFLSTPVAAQILEFDKTTGKLSPASNVAMAPIPTEGLQAALESNQYELGTLPRPVVPTELLASVVMARSLTVSSPAATGDRIWSVLSRADSAPHLYSSSFTDSTIGEWQINPDRSLDLIGLTTSASLAPEDQALGTSGGMDITVSVNGEDAYLYALNSPRDFSSGAPTAHLVGFRIDHDGSLVRLGNAVASKLSNSGFGLSAL
jgi:hypothetical protein